MDNKTLIGWTLPLVLAAATAQADDHQRWYINPAVGYQFFDSDRDVDDDVLGALGIEYRFSESWAIELRGMYSEPEFEVTGDDIDVTQYSLTGQYYFGGENGPLKPFAVFGLGHGEYEFANDDAEETQVHLGLGFRYLWTDNWSFRSEVRNLWSDDEDANDQVVMIGISYGFGGKKAAAPAPAPQPVDSDGDGVYDDQDQCPNTPAGEAVNSVGCPLDSDGDGVTDDQDQCPNTPAGKQVDEKGCELMLQVGEEVRLEINFATNQSIVRDAYLPEVEKIADFMKRHPEQKVVIEGHTDSLGAAGYNKRLSQRRAEAVRASLINQFGIAGDRVEAVGYGEEQPVAGNDTKEGRQANRRVVAELKSEGQ